MGHTIVKWIVQDHTVLIKELEKECSSFGLLPSPTVKMKCRNL